MAVFHVDSREHGAAGLFPKRADLVDVLRSFLAEVQCADLDEGEGAAS